MRQWKYVFYKGEDINNLEIEMLTDDITIAFNTYNYMVNLSSDLMKLDDMTINKTIYKNY